MGVQLNPPEPPCVRPDYSIAANSEDMSNAIMYNGLPLAAAVVVVQRHVFCWNVVLGLVQQTASC